MFTCKYCGKQCKNANSLRNHERLCKLNPNRQKSCFEDKEFQKNVLHKNGSNNQYTKAKALGLPKPVIKEQTRKKLSEAAKSNNPMYSEKSRKKLSETIRKKVDDGTWHTSLAKRMHINYKGNDLHGSWEVAYAKYLDSQNINWVRNKHQFKYYYNDTWHTYTPDFYLLDSDTYVEIKGYKTKKDDAKWEQFPIDKKLVILRYLELAKLNII